MDHNSISAHSMGASSSKKETSTKRVTFAPQPISETVSSKYNVKENPSNNNLTNLYENVNQFSNKSWYNILQESTKLSAFSNATIMLPKAPGEDKENRPVKTSSSPSPDYRLLYRLYTSFKDTQIKPIELWGSITSQYNFISGAEFSPNELFQLWNRTPPMTKRKLELEDIEVPIETKKKKVNKKTLNKSILKKPADQLMFSPEQQNSIQTQDEPVDFSAKKKSAKLTKASKIKKVKTNYESKGTQTDPTNDDEKVYGDLQRKELNLKISILELKLKYLQSQYKKQFER